MNNELRVPDSIDTQRLQAMQMVAKMKEKADRMGIGFVGGFITPTGEKFTMTNIEDLDITKYLPE
jgi:hypothetical protein